MDTFVSISYFFLNLFIFAFTFVFVRMKLILCIVLIGFLISINTPVCYSSFFPRIFEHLIEVAGDKEQLMSLEECRGIISNGQFDLSQKAEYNQFLIDYCNKKIKEDIQKKSHGLHFVNNVHV